MLAALAGPASAQIYATDFTTLDGWVVTVPVDCGASTPKWAADATPASHHAGPFWSAPASLNFNNGIDFEPCTGRGLVRSPLIDLGLATDTPLLRFMHSASAERRCEWDVLTLRVGSAAGGPPLLETCVDHSVLFSPWKRYEYLLDRTWGQVWIEFEFDVVDELANDLSGVFIDDLEVIDSCSLDPSSPCNQALYFCFGDGSGTACPCGNISHLGERRRCRNSTGKGARLDASGQPDVGADTLRFPLDGGPPFSFAFLISGGVALPMSSPGAGLLDADGLRCVGGGLTRHGARSTDSAGTIGVTTPGWGPPNGPPGGLAAQGGFVPGQSRYFQVLVRDDITQVCGTGGNRSNGVKITFR